MSRRKPREVEWGAWGCDLEQCAMVRHAEGTPAPDPSTITDDPDLVLTVTRTGWWRTVPVRGEDWTTEWKPAYGSLRGAFHATLYVESWPPRAGSVIH